MSRLGQAEEREQELSLQLRDKSLQVIQLATRVTVSPSTHVLLNMINTIIQGQWMLDVH